MGGVVDKDVSSGLDADAVVVADAADEEDVPVVAVSDFLVPRRLLLFFVSRLMMDVK